MKAVVARELSGPSGLVYTDVDDIDDAVDGMVVIDVRAAGVNFPDLLLTRGEYQLKLAPPFVLGMEVAGVVRSVPEDSRLRPGDHVGAFTMMGGYAERVAVAPENVVPTAAGLDDAQAAALLGNYYTMYFALARRGALRPDETVLVLGSAGGIGTAAVQIAKALGARVIAGVHREKAFDFVSSLGADAVIRLTDGWLDVVRELTDGNGVDLVVDMLSGPVVVQTMKATAVRGRIVNVGRLAGMKAEFDFDLHALRRIDYIGVTFRTRTLEEVREIGRRMRADLWQAVTAGKLRLPIDRRFSLHEAAAAQAHMR
ncbi:MAG: NADPH:quinone oxidoreductase family protein, partial [Mycobacteriaceae bacterium]|nr:NADPH:quinone oxidoreductase family protein [Mycobacteriaceae bacterium]